MVKRNDLTIQVPETSFQVSSFMYEFDLVKPPKTVQPPQVPRMPCFAPVYKKKRASAVRSPASAASAIDPKPAFRGKPGSQEWQRDVGTEFKRGLQNHPEARFVFHLLFIGHLGCCFIHMVLFADSRALRVASSSGRR